MTVFFYYQWSINRSWDKQQYKKQTHCACDMVLRPCSRYDSTYSYQCLSLHLMSHSYVHTTHAWKCSLAAVTVCDTVFFCGGESYVFETLAKLYLHCLSCLESQFKDKRKPSRWWLYLSVKEEWAFIIFSCRLQQPVSMLIAVLLFVWSASTNLLSAMTFHPYRYVKNCLIFVVVTMPIHFATTYCLPLTIHVSTTHFRSYAIIKVFFGC